MPKQNTLVQIGFTDSDTVLLDRLRRQEPDLPTRPEIVRRLVRVGLANAIATGAATGNRPIHAISVKNPGDCCDGL